MFDRRRHSPDCEEDAEVRRLLVEAGARPVLPEEDLAGIAAAARAAWQEQLAAPLGERPTSERPWLARPPRKLGPRVAWGLAAAAVVAIGAAGWWLSAGRSVGAMAVRADRVDGRVEVQAPVPGTAALAAPRTLAAGDSVALGARLTTAGVANAGAGSAAGGAALRMPGGASLRLAEATRVRLLAAGRIELEVGAVYIDHASGPATAGRKRGGIEVVTPYGQIVEIGTQFSVRRTESDPHLEVRVREGEVEVVRPGAAISAGAGIELLVGRDGSILRREIAAHGPEWDWVLDRAPAFDIEGRSLGEFLGWVGRETGWRIELSPAARARAAGDIVLHGSTAGLRPDRAVFVVLSGADLSGERRDGTLQVRLRQGDRD